MATLPTLADRRPTPSPSRNIAQISPTAASAVGAAVQQLGGVAAQVGEDMLDREATAQAKEADALAAEKIRALLYDPENGFANMSGGSAVSQRDRVAEQIKQLSGSITEGLSPAAKRKLEDSLNGRVERALQTIDTHTSAERKTWINGASVARIESAYQDSLVNPGETAASLRVMEQEYRGMAAREGWSAEETEMKIGEGRSKVYAGIATRLASVDPVAAADYLSQNRGNMLGSDVVALEAKLVPLAKEYRGRRAGQLAAGDISSELFRRANDTLGMDENEQQAALQEYMRNGGVNIDPAKTAWCAAYVNATLAQAGVSGTGSLMARSFLNWGTAVDTPQKGDIVVLTRGDPNGASGHVGIFEGMNEDGTIRILGGNQGNRVSVANYSTANVLGYRRATAREGIGGGITSLLDIEDPIERAAAVEEYNLRASVAKGAQKAAHDAAADAAFQVIESGGSLNDLDAEQRISIGQEGMSSLRAYERSVRSGIPVETDLSAYASLRRMAADDPAAFRALDITSYADRLSLTDRKSLIDMQTNPSNRANEIAASTLMTTATNQLRAVGIKPNAPEEALVQTQLLRWQDAYIAKNGEAPSALDIDRKVGQLLAPVVINPPGPLNEAEGRVFDTFKVDEAGLVTGDISIGGQDIPQAVVQEQVAVMKAAGEMVTADALIARLSALMNGDL